MNQSYQYQKGILSIENYHQKKPFASFLPGIAGKFGIPMWVYYVNRGQLISSFGLESKDQPILDFSPANMAYRRTEIDGFRTFLKIDGKLIEPFRKDQYVSRKMLIETNAVGISEENLGVKITVKYFNVTNQSFPGLVRKVTIENLDDKPKNIELVDGLATLWPFGTSQFSIKNMSNLAVAWFDVLNQEHKFPMFKNRSTTGDTAEVEDVSQGHFYGTFDQNNELLDVIYDPTLIFGYDLALDQALHFKDETLNELLSKKQTTVNQLMSGFSAKTLKLSDSYSFYTLFGKTNSLEELHHLEKTLSFDYFKNQELLAINLGEEITSPMDIKTAYPMFDAYVKQSFLDNLLRGGFPYVFKGKDHDIVYHTFSRIHGDMEREYNNFYTEAAYFSQGNGSYRDVNQNRRNDVFFVKEAALFNIKQFLDLIQTDGHNPLTIQGSKLVVAYEDINSILSHVKANKDVVKKILDQPFSPGQLMTQIDFKHVELDLSKEAFLDLVMSYATQEIQSVHGTGYWSDHWIYNLDLLDSYDQVFPDQLKTLLLDTKFRFYQNHVSSYPRNIKYVLTPKGHVRQLGPIYDDHDKIAKTKLKVNQTNFVKHENGSVVEVTLVEKLIHLVSIKFASLDPAMIGIMMDSEKPGWNDAMNGLPAIFGSGLTETISLKRTIEYLLTHLELLDESRFNVQVQILNLFKSLVNYYDEGFDKVQDIREQFDLDTKYFLSDDHSFILKEELLDGLKQLHQKVVEGLEKGKNIGDGLLPTYLTFEATSYEKLGQKHPELGYDCVKVNSWNVRMLPHYLEAPATYLKQLKDKDEAKKIYDHIRKTEMYDQKLGIYLTSNPLDEETLDIGRARAFTKGWLEREACFMHMGYKYLIGVLKSGLYQEYFNDIKKSFPPFMDPDVYGRSPLENASFIATSNNPNEQNHGRAFVARLTGTTSELITLVMLMMVGKHLFSYVNEQLVFEIKPALAKDFFDENNEVSFKLFSHTKVTIKNETRNDTFYLGVQSYELKNKDESILIDKPQITGHLASQIRDLTFDEIIVTLK